MKYATPLILLTSALFFGCEQHYETSRVNAAVDGYQRVAESILAGSAGNVQCLNVWQRGVTSLEVEHATPGLNGALNTAHQIPTQDRSYAFPGLSHLVTSLLVFRAVDEAKIASLDVPISQLLPKAYSTKAWRRITVKQLLMMQSGYSADERLTSLDEREHPRNQRQLIDDFDAYLSSLTPQTSAPHYHGAHSIILAKVLEAVYQQPFEDLAQTMLLNHIDVHSAQWHRYLASGHPQWDSGLEMTCNDAAKLGQFVMQKGEWDQQPIIQPAWFDVMLNPSSGHTFPGFEFETLSMPMYVGDGAGEQVMVIIPERQAVIVVAASEYHGVPDELKTLIQETLPMLRL